jgi:UDP-N-acetylmuramoylalanine--D-glutamate ligase
MAGQVEQAVRDAGLSADHIHTAGTVDRAVQIARTVARSGDVVLLSPGGTSYDQYHDFEERGDHFAAVVRASAQGRHE